MMPVETSSALALGPSRFDDPRLAGRYAQALLEDLGLASRFAPAAPEQPAWQRAIASGWARLTGPADGPPAPCPAPLTAAADGALAALKALKPDGQFLDLDGAALLAERAAAWNQSRQGLCSPGGSCQLYPTADGWIALNLARPSDQDLLPAWLDMDTAVDEAPLGHLLLTRQTTSLVGRARLLGMAVAAEQPLRTAPPWRVLRRGRDARSFPRSRPLRVLDCSALWAGPLCGQLLSRAGADVVKLESRQRPDGARSGPASLFTRLNKGKSCVQLDFDAAAGRTALHQLVAAADVLIEASRPRALKQLGIDAEHWLDAAPGRTWIRIRGYSAEEDPDGMGVAFGDDAGVAAGLSHLMTTHGARWLVGDAVGDPLTGLHAAVAGYALSLQGGGLVEVALTDTLRHAASFATLPSPEEWTTLMRKAPPSATWPRGRIPGAGAPIRAAGADNLEVFARWIG